MPRLSSIEDVFKSGCCTSCGLCFSQMKTVEKNGTPVPVALKKGGSFDVALCPGKGYSLSNVMEQKSHSSPLLGGWESFHAVRSTNPAILKNAASGGIMTSIALKALESGLADGIIVTGLVCRNGKIQTETFVAAGAEDLFRAQGSKYMPVPALARLTELIEKNKRYVYVGTPCQIAGVRLLQRKNEIVRKGIVLTVGNFCGGYRDLRERAAIFNQLNIREEDVVEFAYRRGTQPGYMLIRLRDGREFHLPYPAYARLTGYTVLRRCRLCMDATAELADFSCGDAWLDRFKGTGNAWSVLISRTSESEQLLSLLRKDPSLQWESITEDEIFAAQRGNITTKKIRQSARRTVYSLLGCALPEFGLPAVSVSVQERFFEFKVLFSHTLFAVLQEIGCYPFVAKLLKRSNCRIEVQNAK